MPLKVESSGFRNSVSRLGRSLKTTRALSVKTQTYCARTLLSLSAARQPWYIFVCKRMLYLPSASWFEHGGHTVAGLGERISGASMCKRKSVGCECRGEGASRAGGGEYEEESNVFRGVVDLYIEKEWSWQTFFRKMFRLRGDRFSIVLIPKTKDDVKYRRCRCPKWIDGYVDRKRARHQLQESTPLPAAMRAWLTPPIARSLWRTRPTHTETIASKTPIPHVSKFVRDVGNRG